MRSMRSRNSLNVAFIWAMSVRASATTLRPAMSLETSALSAKISSYAGKWVMTK